jgi:hypothetical protein
VAIRRFTVEFDDQPDRGITQIPAELGADETTPLKPRALTSIGDPSDDVPSTAASSPEVNTRVGRTFADIFADFIDDPRVITVLLFLLPYTAYAFKIESANDLLTPFWAGLFLCVVWFGISLGRRLIAK